LIVGIGATFSLFKTVANAWTSGSTRSATLKNKYAPNNRMREW